MDSIQIRAADILLSAVRLNPYRPEEQAYEPEKKMVLTCTDVMTGTTHTKILIDDEVEAVIACLLSDSGEGTPDQYAVASKAVEGFPPLCRPIP